MLLFTVAACGGGGTTTTPSGGIKLSSLEDYVVYTVGMTDYMGRFIQGLSPAECPPATDAVFDQIVKIDPKTKQIFSDVLTDFYWEDDNTFVMKLRDDVYFSNGAQATAEDVVYCYTSWPERGATGLDTFGILFDQCAPRDKFTAVLKFDKPFRPFLNTTVHLICKAWAEEVGWDSMEWYQPVGSGPYLCTEYVVDDHIVLKAREDYWNLKETGPFYVDEWNVKYYKDASTMYMDLEVGKLDLAEVQANDYARWTKQGGNGFDVLMTRSGVTQYFTFSFQDFPAWSDKRLRQAVAMGVNWEELGTVAYTDMFVPAKSLAPEAAPTFINPGKYEYSPEKAKALLAEAGYGPDKPLEIYSIFMDSQLYKALAENIQYQFKQIGINLKMDFTDIMTAINVWNAPGDTDIGFWWLISGAPAFDLYNTIPVATRLTPTFSYIPENLFPEFYKMYNRLVYTSDLEDAAKASKEIQQYNFDEVLYIPYHEMTGAFGYRTDRFTLDQIKSYVVFVNMYQLGRLGFASAWQ
jgi:ABC-type transport system substrate-binding protein